MTNNITAGRYLLRGLELIAKPALRKFVVIPFVINIIIFVGIIWTGSHYLVQLMQTINQHLPSWLHWMHWLLWLLWLVFGLASMVIIFYSFTSIANLIAAPFNGLLAEQVELYLTGVAPPSSTRWWNIIKSIPVAFIRQIRLLIYYLLRSAVLWLLMLIPFVHIVAVAVWFLFTAWMACLQYMDYPMDNNHVSLSRMRNLLAEKRVSALSFGTMTMLFTMVPILNFFAMPAAVAGAVAFWVEEFKGK